MAEHHRKDDDHSPISRDHHAKEPSAGDQLGEAAGGIGGVLTGAGLGSLGGPIGTIIGGIAGAAGGWWAGRSVSEAAAHYTKDESAYRTHYDSHGDTLRDMDYDTARVGYGVGHIAGRNPDYRGRKFDEVEPHLREGFSGKGEEYERQRPYIRHAYERNALGNDERNR